MLALFGADVSRRAIVDGLFGHSDIAAIAAEHGVDRGLLLAEIANQEGSEAGARLREAVTRMRHATDAVPKGAAFPTRLERATDGALELIGLYVNPLMTTSLILHTQPPALEEVARSIDARLSLARYASRVFRVLAVQHPKLAEPLSNAAGALERA